MPENSYVFMQRSAGYLDKAIDRVNKYYFPTIQQKEEDWEQIVLEEMYGDAEFGEEALCFNIDDVFDFEEEEDQEWGVQ